MSQRMQWEKFDMYATWHCGSSELRLTVSSSQCTEALVVWPWQQRLLTLGPDSRLSLSSYHGKCLIFLLVCLVFAPAAPPVSSCTLVNSVLLRRRSAFIFKLEVMMTTWQGQQMADTGRCVLSL